MDVGVGVAVDVGTGVGVGVEVRLGVRVDLGAVVPVGVREAGVVADGTAQEAPVARISSAREIVCRVALRVWEKVLPIQGSINTPTHG